MSVKGSISMESDWLPPAELQRLLDEPRMEFPEISIATTESSHRGLDPAVASALVSGAVALLTPFVTKVVERLFKKEPKAWVEVGDGVVLRPGVTTEQCKDLVAQALTSGTIRVRINLEVSKG
jgi:hypothetical protein